MNENWQMGTEAPPEYLKSVGDVPTPSWGNQVSTVGDVCIAAHRRMCWESQGHIEALAAPLERAAHLWTALLRDRLKEGAVLEARDVVGCLLLLTMANEWLKPEFDNRVDLAVYAEYLQVIEDAKGES